MAMDFIIYHENEHGKIEQLGEVVYVQDAHIFAETYSTLSPNKKCILKQVGVSKPIAIYQAGKQI